LANVQKGSNENFANIVGLFPGSFGWFGHLAMVVHSISASAWLGWSCRWCSRYHPNYGYHKQNNLWLKCGLTMRAPDAAPRPPFLDRFAGAARVTQTVRPLSCKRRIAMAKRKGYAVVRIHIQREIEVELDDEIEQDNQKLVEKIITAKYGELNIEIDEPDEVEILEIDYAD
jgi:hypothetical protein